MNPILAKLKLLAALAASAFPAVVSAEPVETRVPDMARYIEWVVAGENGVYVRAYNGRWYLARTREVCPRLVSTQRLDFRTAPNGDLDRFGALIVEGWRCQLDSVTASEPPPSRQ